MKPREYRLMEECVERGVRHGIARARKHDDDPGEDALLEKIHQAVMLEICESWAFDDSPQD